MKKFAKKYKGLLLGGAGLLLVLAMALSVKVLPYTNAKYVSNIPNVPGGADPIKTGISGISNDDMDTLLRIMMNARYPVGSLYITTSVATAEGMTALFGGGWTPYGGGRALVGFTGSMPATGGSAIGGNGGMNATIRIAGDVDANKALLDGRGWWSTVGTLGVTSYPVTLRNPTGTMTQNWSMPLVNHTHTLNINGITTASSNLGSRTQVSPCCSSNENMATGNNGTGTVTTNPKGSGTPVTFTSAYPNLTNAPSYTYPTYSLTNPSWNAPQLQNTISGLPMPFSYDKLTFTIPDKTLQPYVTVYMYVRSALAPMPPMP